MQDWATSLIFYTVQNLGVVKKIKVAQEDILSWFSVGDARACMETLLLFGHLPTTARGYDFWALKRQQNIFKIK